jgi:predicted phage terminase large subunit-like protein
MGFVRLPRQVDVAATLFHLERDRCERSLSYFIKHAWKIVEPGMEYVHNWHIDIICEHLEAITDGIDIDGKPYNRLLINVPPRMMKSRLLNVFWPAWEWGPRNLPHKKFLCISHSQERGINDSIAMRRLLKSPWYQERWPHVVLQADQDAKTRYENTATGHRVAVAANAITGEGGNRVIIDDPLSWMDAQSEQIRNSTNDWFLGAVPSRLNDQKKDAIIVIMQRLHEEDTSGTILDRQLGYDHLMLPMRYDPARSFPTMLGTQDPRTEEGELIFPERFPLEVVDRNERTMGEYEISGQHQQAPVPKGGGIIKDDWWTLWKDDNFPELDYILAIVDTAYGEKQENDYSAMVVLGVFTVQNKATISNTLNRYGTRQQIQRVYAEGAPNVVLMNAWKAKLQFHELVNRILATGKKFKIDRLVVEDKAAGASILQELHRVASIEEFGISAVTPRGDKWQRLYSVSHLWSEGMVWAPDKEWAEMVIREVSTFPKGKHDDLVDCMSHGMKYLRDNGLLSRAPERLYDIEESKRWTGKAPPALYPG